MNHIWETQKCLTQIGLLYLRIALMPRTKQACASATSVPSGFNAG